MERVREAINKAREHRKSKSSLDYFGNAAGVASRESIAKTLTGRQPRVIEYRQTKTVDLDASILEKNRIVSYFEDDERAEVYRQLRSQVLAEMTAKRWRSLAITSPGEGAGKTHTMLNLAIAMSKQHNRTILLVDLDLRSPSVAKTLGIEIDKGIVDCITGQESLENILINPKLQKLVLLPGRPTDTYSSELLTSAAMKLIMKDIISKYDDRLVLFDMPPLLRNDDALVFAPMVDANILVVEDGVDTPDQIKRSLHLLKGCNLMGTILNKARG